MTSGQQGRSPCRKVSGLITIFVYFLRTRIESDTLLRHDVGLRKIMSALRDAVGDARKEARGKWEEGLGMIWLCKMSG